MGCRERRQHRHVRQDLPDREDRLDAFAGCHHFAAHAKADRIAEKTRLFARYSTLAPGKKFARPPLKGKPLSPAPCW